MNPVARVVSEPCGSTQSTVRRLWFHEKSCMVYIIGAPAPPAFPLAALPGWRALGLGLAAGGR